MLAITIAPAPISVVTGAVITVATVTIPAVTVAMFSSIHLVAPIMVVAFIKTFPQSRKPHTDRAQLSSLLLQCGIRSQQNYVFADSQFADQVFHSGLGTCTVLGIEHTHTLEFLALTGFTQSSPGKNRLDFNPFPAGKLGQHSQDRKMVAGTGLATAATLARINHAGGVHHINPLLRWPGQGFTPSGAFTKQFTEKTHSHILCKVPKIMVCLNVQFDLPLLFNPLYAILFGYLLQV
jgi:hypothetical protein